MQRETYDGKRTRPCKRPEDFKDLELGFVADCLRSRYSAHKIVLVLPISKRVESVMRRRTAPSSTSSASGDITLVGHHGSRW